MVGEHRVEGVDFGSPNCPESIFTPGQFFGSFDALGFQIAAESQRRPLQIASDSHLGLD